MIFEGIAFLFTTAGPVGSTGSDSGGALSFGSDSSNSKIRLAQEK
jgi:hypothetical protein